MTPDNPESASVAQAAATGREYSALRAPLEAAMTTLQTLTEAVQQQVLGRDEVIQLVIIALVADGHVLLEDFPGSGKTTLAKALGEAIARGVGASEVNDAIVGFRRIQFTPDLLPSDVTGVPVFDSRSNAFHFRHGPLFAHVVLADEINRTSPKVQSAMLEAMGEKQITVDNVTYPLDDLFFVIATQNPLDLAGTYPLPTPQLDRFLFKITMEHIGREAELAVLDTCRERRDRKETGRVPGAETMQPHDQGLLGVSRAAVLDARQAIDRGVNISRHIKETLVDISRNLRGDERVLQGNSTRSMVLLLPALQVAAALQGRDYVSADDVEWLLPRVLGHRIELAPGAASMDRILADNMREPMERLARSTLA